MSTNEATSSSISSVNQIPDPINHQDFYNNPLERGLDYRKNSPIYHLRTFNNWIKSTLIADYLSRIERQQPERRGKLAVFDIGCGKGGDQLKWKIGNVRYVIFADLASEALKVCEERFKCRNFKYEANFITIDCGKDLLRDALTEQPDGKPGEPFLDLASTQFVMHYSFKSFASADRFIRNAAELLRIGGYFIGTTVDSYQVVKRCRQSPNQTLSNDIFRLVFDPTTIDLNKDEIPLFGAEYIFSLDELVNCPEYLIYFPVLVNLAEKHGMKLVERHLFTDYFDLKSKTREGANLLQRMDTLEKYSLPSNNRVERNPPINEDQFEHAAKYIHLMNETNQKSISSCQTLSKQEWEIESLYIVFAFQKVRHIKYDDVSPVNDHNDDDSK